MDGAKLVVDYGIIGILFLMSTAAVGIAIERFSFIKRARLEEYPTAKELEITLTKRFYIIASIGSNAPYIGLLGTVIGIIFTFYQMGDVGNIDTKTIMIGLSLALKATAAGLLVAIPCVSLYNVLLRRVKEKVAAYESKSINCGLIYGRERV